MTRKEAEETVAFCALGGHRTTERVCGPCVGAEVRAVVRAEGYRSQRGPTSIVCAECWSAHLALYHPEQMKPEPWRSK